MTLLPLLLSMPLFVIPGADFPPWAPFVFGLIGLVTLAVLIWQAVRYFRNNPPDDDNQPDGDDPGNDDTPHTDNP